MGKTRFDLGRLDCAVLGCHPRGDVWRMVGYRRLEHGEQGQKSSLAANNGDSDGATRGPCTDLSPPR